MMNRVLVFGDSIAYGGWDTEGGWVERVKKDAHKATTDSLGETKTQVLNLGIGGNSSSKVLDRFENETAVRCSPSWPAIILFSFGANDQRSFKGKCENDLELFKENTRNLIELAKKYSSKIAFIECPPIGDEVVMFKGWEYSNVRLREYMDAQKNIVTAAGLPFIETWGKFDQQDSYVYDNLHLNDKGHEILHKIASTELQKLLGETK